VNANPLEDAGVDETVWTLTPSYAVLLITTEGLQPGPSDASSESVVRAAEREAAGHTAGRAPEELAEVEAWRAAYRSFGAKPQRTRSSLEALLRRIPTGLPRVDRLTDVYNAVSVAYRLPIGGEDLDTYAGPPRLVRAVGDEPFDTTKDGAVVQDPPEQGEVVWRDDIGVTCRRWNWRQCLRTRLSPSTTRALFVLDWLPAGSEQFSLETAADALLERLAAVNPGMRARTRLLIRAEARTHHQTMESR
jgi:DNA/RNA-binding domain of Phe-tRNA-synthetase-like protein